MLKKKIGVVLMFICSGATLLADATGISIRADVQSRILTSGDKLPVQVDYSFPENRFFSGYLLSAYLPYVPKAFSEATGIPVNKNQDPRWSSLNISGWQWFEGGKRQPGKLDLEFDTTSWPPGDYKLELRGLFRDIKTSVESDLYRSAYFYLTITEP
ncbi:MAG: hypothetical protein WCT05_01320 [Lentisphaeria bacterium]